MRVRLLPVCLLAAAAWVQPAFASKDIVQFGNSVTIAPDQAVHDTVCFFCSVDNNGTVDGDIVVFFGNVHINGHANHDVVTFFGDVTADSDSSIGQDLVNFFGSIRLGDRVSVGKDTVCMFGSLHAASTASIGGDRVVEPAMLFWLPLVVVFLIVYLVVHEIRNARRRRLYMRGYPFPPPPPPPQQ